MDKVVIIDATPAAFTSSQALLFIYDEGGGIAAINKHCLRSTAVQVGCGHRTPHFVFRSIEQLQG